MTQERRSQRGVSLIEAIVALGVMAFGMLAVAGMQVTLRGNGDLSKQRAQAVRIAQTKVEDWRAFATIETTAGVVAYADLTTDAAPLVEPDPDHLYNATYSVNRTVTPWVGGSPPMKSLLVTVSWADRTGNNQSVQLSSVVAGVPPELAGSLAIAPSGVLKNPDGRNSAIPRASTDLGNGTSGFVPPQAPGGTVVWVFNNTTALMQVCAINNVANPLALANISCPAAGYAQLVSGFVNFANTAAQATAQEAVAPTGNAVAVQVQVMVTAPAALVVGPGSGCFTASPVAGQSYLGYYCGVPVSVNAQVPAPWSGYAIVTGAALPVAPVPGNLATCRYTSVRNDNPVPAIPNLQHPRAYVGVSGPLLNQNFLVVRDVNNNASDCPDGAPLPAGSTTYPQPQTAP